MMKTATRILAIPLVLACCAWSFVQWLYRLARGKDFEDREKFRHFFGWLAPEMELHWRRLWSHLPWKPAFDWKAARAKGYTGQPGSIYHAAKNVPVELIRLVGPELTAKGGSFIVFALIAIALAGWLT